MTSSMIASVSRKTRTLLRMERPSKANTPTAKMVAVGTAQPCRCARSMNSNGRQGATTPPTAAAIGRVACRRSLNARFVDLAANLAVPTTRKKMVAGPSMVNAEFTKLVISSPTDGAVCRTA